MALNRAIAASCRENYAAYAGDSDASLQAVLAASRRSAPRQVRHVSHDDDAQLAAALQASLRETTPARPAMSEDEQLAAALQASLQAPVVTPPSSYAPSSSLGRRRDARKHLGRLWFGAARTSTGSGGHPRRRDPRAARGRGPAGHEHPGGHALQARARHPKAPGLSGGADPPPPTPLVCR